MPIQTANALTAIHPGWLGCGCASGAHVRQVSRSYTSLVQGAPRASLLDEAEKRRGLEFEPAETNQHLRSRLAPAHPHTVLLVG